LFLLFVNLNFQDKNQLFSQDPFRLQTEVAHLDSLIYNFDTTKDIILFTGSSSIRKWDSIPNYFHGYQIINTGFGGSQMSDLLFYADQLILKYSPDIIFIYEGDNDIAEGKTIKEIMLTTDTLLTKLKQRIPDVEIVFISAKPSLARWGLKDDYLALNSALRSYCNNNKSTYFADIWNVMLDKDGNPTKNLFVDDGLHMTKAGYMLWAEELLKYLK